MRRLQREIEAADEQNSEVVDTSEEKKASTTSVESTTHFQATKVQEDAHKSSEDSASFSPKKRSWRSLRWNMLDITTASVIGVASAFIFWAAQFLPYSALQILVPGLGAILNGIWLFAGPLAAVIIRKPGAAIYAETLAAIVEALMGSAWGGAKTILEGLVQGIGAEVAFLICMYAVWNIWTVMLSGALSGLALWLQKFFTHFQAMSAKGLYSVTYLGFTVLSGICIAGIAVWILYNALRATGVLSRFPGGRRPIKKPLKA